MEPYAEVGGLQADLAGRLSDFVGQLENLWQELLTPRTPEQWEALFSDMLGHFFQDLEGHDLLLLNRFRRHLEQWLDDALAAGLAETQLPLNIVKDVLLEGLDESGLNQRFLAGKVNFATLMPMRAIPFRVVCLLGMNDGDYPRSRPPVDFDLMANDYRPGIAPGGKTTATCSWRPCCPPGSNSTSAGWAAVSGTTPSGHHRYLSASCRTTWTVSGGSKVSWTNQ